MLIYVELASGGFVLCRFGLFGCFWFWFDLVICCCVAIWWVVMVALLQVSDLGVRLLDLDGPV